MTFIRALLIRFGLWLASLGGWRPCALPHLPDDARLASVAALVADIDQRFPRESGLYKQREALRVLLNQFPGTRTRDLALLIELALQR